MPAREQPFKAGRHARRGRPTGPPCSTWPSPGRAGLRGRAGRAGPARARPTRSTRSRALRAREPGVALTLLLGADAAAELDAWHRAAELPGLARIVVFARPGTPMPVSPLIAGTVEVPAIEISATEIRRRVREGRPIRYWVPDAVAEYMARHRLYLDPE